MKFGTKQVIIIFFVTLVLIIVLNNFDMYRAFGDWESNNQFESLGGFPNGGIWTFSNATLSPIMTQYNFPLTFVVLLGRAQQSTLNTLD